MHTLSMILVEANYLYGERNKYKRTEQAHALTHTQAYI